MKIHKKIIGSFSILLVFFSLCLYAFAFWGISYMVEEDFSEYLEAKGELGYALFDKKNPGEWVALGGELYKGDTLINNNNREMKEISNITGSHVTIFLNDTRIATTIEDESGDPITGTKASPEVIRQVLMQQDTFLGETKVLGVDHTTYYRPILDAQNQVVGMWFVGIPQSIVKEDIYSIMRSIALILFFMLVCGVVVAYLFANSMLKSLSNSEEKHRAIFNTAGEPILIFDESLQILSANPSACHVFGYSEEELLTKKLEELITSSEHTDRSQYSTMLHNGDTVVLKCLPKTKRGDIIYAEANFKKIHWENSEAVLSVFHDVTERKKAEDSIVYLSYHDQLTGLYNRRFYEEELRRIDVPRNLPLTIIFGDANELKLINDSFGHAVGDELLRKTADAFRDACRADDMVARIGGDEFVLLLPQAGPVEAEKIIARVSSILSQKCVEGIELSVSFGYETKWEQSTDIDDVFNKAEKYMYKKKLIDRARVRNKTLHSIIQILYQRSPREKFHAERVSALCEKIGDAMGISGIQLAEWKAAASFHDIGKIAIQENILNKGGLLSEDEWMDVKRHPEVAYRVLSSLPALTGIAEFVLAHHERWDGRGYPKGLRGDEIPLASRVIAIADTYDAMTSESSYQKVFTQEEAIKELKENSGQKYDAELVKIFIEKVLPENL